jgi:hypothetical protein
MLIIGVHFFSALGTCARCLLLRTPQLVHCRIPLCPEDEHSVLSWTMLHLVPVVTARGAGCRKGATPTSQFPKRLMLPKFPAFLGCPRALELPLAVALADMPLDLVQHVLFLFPSTRFLVLTGGPMQALAVVTSRFVQQRNSQPQEQSFLSSFFVACPGSNPPPWKVTQVALDGDSAQAGWYLLT